MGRRGRADILCHRLARASGRPGNHPAAEDRPGVRRRLRRLYHVRRPAQDRVPGNGCAPLRRPGDGRDDGLCRLGRIGAGAAQGRRTAEKLGYPVILNAAHGGGGRGMRLVKKSEDVISSYKSASQESLTAFGNEDMYIEKFIENPRHVEVQILADSHGNAIHLGERECSIQRRHQKLVEESPSPLVDEETRKLIGAAAVAGAKAVNYVGVGTIEFLMDKNKNYFFMEMNTRIQVEHPVTEMVTGVDLIKQQIKMHAGLKYPEYLQDFKLRGHSIECRINAEDPANNFMPFPGEITNFHMPGGKGVRVDTHAYSGYKIPTEYDSMIGKIIVHAKNRERAIIRMYRALEETIIAGPKTTIPYQMAIMENEIFKSGNFDTSFLETFDYNPEKYAFKEEN